MYVCMYVFVNEITSFIDVPKNMNTHHTIKEFPFLILAHAIRSQ